MYYFDLYDNIKPERVLFLKGDIYDEQGEIINDLEIEIKNLKTQEIKKIKVNGGNYAAALTLSQYDDVLITIKKKGYAFNSRYISGNDTSFNSVCEMIIEIFKNEKISFTKKAATYLYAGMITDSGRFLYLKKPKRTFELASYVCSFNPDIESIYKYLYTEKLAKRLIKNKFSQFKLSSKNVAYRINTMQEIKSTGLLSKN